MKAIILAGGLGSRLAEETYLRPKPMIEIGGKPILWHIMKMYSYYGINDFIICCGYKGYVIKEYFANYFLHMSDVTFDMSNNQMKVHKKDAEDWKVTLIDTGEETQTGGRLKRLTDYLKNEQNFCFTYGDGVSDIDISNSINFHIEHKKLVTITAVQTPSRYGSLVCDDNKVTKFIEKPEESDNFINGGFFILSNKVLDLIKDDNTSWEEGPLNYLAQKNEVMAFKHRGFWQCMDTVRDKNKLEQLWARNSAPWKKW
jgi:glucose-1-phosphate cytidylyltransferase